MPTVSQLTLPAWYTPPHMSTDPQPIFHAVASCRRSLCESSRWVIPPQGSVSLLVQFASDTVRKFSELLGFDVICGERNQKVVMTGACEYPRISTEARCGQGMAIIVSRVLVPWPKQVQSLNGLLPHGTAPPYQTNSQVAESWFSTADNRPMQQGNSVAASTSSFSHVACA